MTYCCSYYQGNIQCWNWTVEAKRGMERICSNGGELLQRKNPLPCLKPGAGKAGQWKLLFVSQIIILFANSRVKDLESLGSNEHSKFGTIVAVNLDGTYSVKYEGSVGIVSVGQELVEVRQNPPSFKIFLNQWHSFWKACRIRFGFRNCRLYRRVFQGFPYFKKSLGKKTIVFLSLFFRHQIMGLLFWSFPCSCSSTILWAENSSVHLILKLNEQPWTS